MNAYEAELREKWDTIDYQMGGSLQLAIEHPLNWYVRYAAPHQKSLVIICDIPVDSIVSSKSIDASCNLRKDGKYAITFTLMNLEQEDVFITMAGDIIQFSREETQVKSALDKVLRRYTAWIKLLDHKRGTLMGENKQKGLIGELLFLRENIEQGRSVSESVAGWGGPEDADQDFVYDDGWHEIKATGASAVAVTISSLEQINRGAPGNLIVYRIDKCMPTYTGAFTLYQLVHDIFNLLSSDSETLNTFILKLAFVGYDDIKDYDKQTYIYSGKQVYQVDEAFPCLTRENVPPEVNNAEYQLNLPSIEQWLK